MLLDIPVYRGHNFILGKQANGAPATDLLLLMWPWMSFDLR